MKQVTCFLFSFSFWSESKLHVKTCLNCPPHLTCIYIQYQPSHVTHIIQPYYFDFIATYYKQIKINIDIDSNIFLLKSYCRNASGILAW